MTNRILYSIIVDVRVCKRALRQQACQLARSIQNTGDIGKPSYAYRLLLYPFLFSYRRTNLPICPLQAYLLHIWPCFLTQFNSYSLQQRIFGFIDISNFETWLYYILIIEHAFILDDNNLQRMLKLFFLNWMKFLWVFFSLSLLFTIYLT